MNVTLLKFEYVVSLADSILYVKGISVVLVASKKVLETPANKGTLTQAVCIITYHPTEKVLLLHTFAGRHEVPPSDKHSFGKEATRFIADLFMAYFVDSISIYLMIFQTGPKKRGATSLYVRAPVESEICCLRSVAS